MSTSTLIEEMMAHTEKIRDGSHESVKPGQPAAFTEACSANDCIWQGDLGLVISDRKKNEKGVFEGYKKSDSNGSTKLVLGGSQGSNHCLESLDGIELYVPEGWSEESLIGPIFVAAEAEAKVVHPIHGAVTVPKGFTIECYYQREWDKEQQRERRARD
jgi:hypothetical protein